MKLSKGTIRPGTVIDILNDGAIKASAPGLFNFSDEPDKLPLIYPWFIGSNKNVYSSPKMYDDVWIMNFSDNPRQLYWFRKDRLSDNTNIPISETNVEILCNREAGGDWCSIYFSDGSGWVISKGGSIIQIRPDGSILLDAGLENRVIDINTQSISLGSKGVSAHPAAYGDAVVDAFMTIVSLLKQLQIVSSINPQTMAIGTAISKALPSVENTLSKIVSPNITLD